MGEPKKEGGGTYNLQSPVQRKRLKVRRMPEGVAGLGLYYDGAEMKKTGKRGGGGEEELSLVSLLAT